MTDFQTGQRGLRLDAPQPGEIVTVKVKRRQTPIRPTGSIFDGMGEESENPQHYRMTGLWRVVAVNGGQAVVEAITGYCKGRREVWPIALHEWFEAGELAEALLDHEVQP